MRGWGRGAGRGVVMASKGGRRFGLWKLAYNSVPGRGLSIFAAGKIFIGLKLL